MGRDIDDILHFRTDLSPFLVHLTKKTDDLDASDVLRTIIEEKELRQSDNRISDARFGIDLRTIHNEDEKKDLFCAICFSETPLNEIHSLLEVNNRKVDLQPYGLVFEKEKLAKKNVAPVFYIYNEEDSKKEVLKALCALREEHLPEAKHILPLIAIFGHKVTGCNARNRQNGKINLYWEREWRYPHFFGNLSFDADDVFIGLCSHKEIPDFEAEFSPITFVDPTRNMKFYAKKLIKARNRLSLKCSVV
jgi:hypothetical protein